MNTYKVVSSNGCARHIMYVNASDKEFARNDAMKLNTLLLRFPHSWHIAYVLQVN